MPAIEAPTSNYGPPLALKLTAHHHQGLLAQKANLGIRYGSVSGNLKPWPIHGNPPKQPLSFREPVPQGLLESIGHQVEHLDAFGVKTPEPQNIYLPPPPSQVPISDYHTIHLEQSNQGDNRGFIGGGHFDASSVSIAHSCNQGPHFGGDAYHAQQSVSYDAQASAQDFIHEHNKKLETKESSYGPPPTGDVAASNVVSHEVLPGLDGLNVISAQRSQSIDLPTLSTGNSGAYEIQLQKSVGSETNNGYAIIGGNNHNQLINDGLLQSIISAVEQSPATEKSDQQNDTSDNSEVKIVFNSKSSADQQTTETPKEVI